MTYSIWSKSRVDQLELIDGENLGREDLEANLRDIERINRYLGGLSAIRNGMKSLLPNGGSVLDVATGGGDIPRDLLRWSRKKGIKLTVVGVDSSPVILEIARSRSADVIGLEYQAGDAGKLPFDNASFDVVLSSLAFHHFDDDFACVALQEMVRVSRKAAVVNDLRRGALPAALIWIVTRLTFMHRMTRNDAPLSVMRSRTIEEYRQLAVRAGFPLARVVKLPFWRALLVVDA